MSETHPAESGAGHETWGWDGATGYRCICGQMLAEESWRNAEPLYRAHVASERSTR